MASLEPRDLLSNESGGTQRQQERGRRGPARRVLLQDEGGHLQRLGHVAGEAAVVLARHHPVEAAAQREAGLAAELADDGVGGQLVVRIEPDGDRTRCERGRVRDAAPARCAHRRTPRVLRSAPGNPTSRRPHSGLKPARAGAPSCSLSGWCPPRG